jgi:hypothetical protein
MCVIARGNNCCSPPMTRANRAVDARGGRVRPASSTTPTRLVWGHHYAVRPAVTTTRVFRFAVPSHRWNTWPKQRPTSQSRTAAVLPRLLDIAKPSTIQGGVHRFVRPLLDTLAKASDVFITPCNLPPARSRWALPRRPTRSSHRATFLLPDLDGLCLGVRRVERAGN